MNKNQIINQRIWHRFTKVLYLKSKIIEPSKDSILEIGPNLSPIFRKEDFNVEYLETVDKSGLIERAKSKNLNITAELVPDIDYIFNSEKGFLGSLSDTKAYNYVASSHVIEHIPDLVKHIIDVESILNANGEYLLIIPDKKFTFDNLKPPTTVGQFLNRYYYPENSDLNVIIDDIIYSTTTNFGKGNWNADFMGSLKSKHTNKLQMLKNIIKEYTSNNFTWYGHFSVFTPISFYNIILILQKLKLITLQVVDLKCTNNMDFICVLSKNLDSKQLSRNEILAHLSKVNYNSLLNNIKNDFLLF